MKNRPHSITFTGPGAKQSFKDECNINKIMAKFQRTGVLNHYAKHAPQYMDVPAIEYLDALTTIADANSMFEELPSTIRAKFENDPSKFLAFVQDPKNLEECRELGLANPSSLSDTQPDTPPKKRASAPPEPPEGSITKDD